MPIHPRTGLRAIFVSPKTGRAYWPILGGSEPPPPVPPPPGAPTPPPKPFTPPSSQEDLDAIINKAVGRAHKQYGGLTPEQVQEKVARAAAMDALELEMSSDIEKAKHQAADEARTAARAESVPRIVTAEFRAAAKGVLTDEQLSAVLEDLDMTKYATADGEADLAKIAAKIAKIAPAQQQQPPGVGQYRLLGQGQQPPAVVAPGEAGRAEAQRRFGDKAATPA